MTEIDGQGELEVKINCQNESEMSENFAVRRFRHFAKKRLPVGLD